MFGQTAGTPSFNFGSTPASGGFGFGQAQSSGGLFGGASAPAFGVQSSNAFSFGSSTPAFGTAQPFGASSAPAFGTPSSAAFSFPTPSSSFGAGPASSAAQSGAAFSFPAASSAGFSFATPASSNPFGFGGASSVAASPFGFGAGAVVPAGQQQQQQQPAGGPGLTTRHGQHVTNATVWEDLAPDAQKLLLDFEQQHVTKHRTQQQELEACPRLHDKRQLRQSPSDAHDRVAQQLRMLAQQVATQREVMAKLRESALELEHDTDAALRSFRRAQAYRQFDQARASHQTIDNRIRELAFSGAVVLPSPFLKRTVQAYLEETRQVDRLVTELQKVVPTAAMEQAEAGHAQAAEQLPSIMRNLHQGFVAVAARLDTVHTAVQDAKEVLLARHRAAGNHSNPFVEAAGREEAQRYTERRQMAAAQQAREVGAQSQQQQQHQQQQGAAQTGGAPAPASGAPQSSAGGLFGATAQSQPTFGFSTPGSGSAAPSTPTFGLATPTAGGGMFGNTFGGGNSRQDVAAGSRSRRRR